MSGRSILVLAVLGVEMTLWSIAAPRLTPAAAEEPTDVSNPATRWHIRLRGTKA